MPLVLGLRYPFAGLRALRKSSLDLLEESVLVMRVRLTDCDVYRHVNNGRYLSLMDMGRIDLVTRCGAMGVFRRNRWSPVAGGATIRFRRELRLGTRYVLRTRCVGWEDTWWYFEQQFERADGSLAARAYAKVTVLDESRSRVPAALVMEQLGVDPQSPPLPAGVASWQASEFG